MLPRVPLEGRLAADPELRFSQSGTAIASLRVVASDRRLNRDTQEWEDGDTLWIDVTCFKQLAENVVESFVKGDLVLIHGKLKTDEWTDREGGKRSKIVMIADAVGASVQWRVLPHAGATHAQRAPANTYRAPVEQAYSGSEEPPF